MNRTMEEGVSVCFVCGGELSYHGETGDVCSRCLGKYPRSLVNADRRKPRMQDPFACYVLRMASGDVISFNNSQINDGYATLYGASLEGAMFCIPEILDVNIADIVWIGSMLRSKMNG